MRVAAIVASGVGALVVGLSAGLALAAESGTDCPATAAPAAQLICRDAALAAAAADLATAFSALGQTTDAAGREALAAAQTAWSSRRDQTCPVAAADLADPKLSGERADCLLRAFKVRTAWAVAQRSARLAPVAEIPLTVGDATAGRPLPPIPTRPVALTRPVTPTAMAGRWAKSDPGNRSPLDDCRTSYLEVSRDLAFTLADPRIPELPIEGRLAVANGGGPQQGLSLSAETGAKGMLRLEVAETPRFDRLFLKMEQPLSLGATYVRCR